MNTKHIFRIIFIFFIFALLSLIAGVTLFHLQIRQHHFFIDLAQRQYTLKIVSTPERGIIYDKNNTLLSSNKEGVAAFIIPRTLQQPTEVLAFLSEHFPQAVARYEKNKDSYFCYVKRGLSEYEEQLIKNSHLSDIQLLKEPRRIYHVPESLTITGITNRDNEGLFGLEWLYNKELTGTPSEYTLEKDAHSHYFSSTKKELTEGTVATSLHTTLDAQLQRIAQEELTKKAEEFHAQEGGLLIMDPQTGEILAAATYPHFELNALTELDMRTTKNNCFTQCYEFGSVCKAFTALAALEEKIVTPDEIIDCHNTKLAYFKKRKITTVTPQGKVTFEEVIQHSNNIGIAKVAFRLQERLYDYLKKLGFGQKTGVHFPGQQYGFINPPNNWSAHSIISLSYGYEMSATLSQIVRAFAVFANNGRLVTPHIIKQKTCPLYPQVASDETIQIMRTILQKTSSKGTGRYGNIPGYTVLAKTGTANFLVNGKYDPDKKIYCFAVIIEHGEYKRVIGCYLKDTSHKRSYASTIVAPLCRTVMEKMIIHEHQIISSF